MIHGKKNYDPVKKYITTYENIRKIAISQGDDYTTDIAMTIKKLIWSLLYI